MQRDVAHALGGARSVHRTAVVLIALIGAITACAPSTRHASVPQPTPCADSLYVRLKGQHPDSLSERAWQRLQSLERDCAAARSQTHAETSSMMGMGHGRVGRWMGMGLVAVVLMAIMMTALR